MSYCSPVIKMVLKLFTKYYLENNFINRGKDTGVLIHSLAFAST